MTSKYNTILYMATNLINGKKYIGITNAGLSNREIRHRFTARGGRGAAIGAAIRKYGDSIKFSILTVCPDLEYAKQMEIAAIAALKPEYNLTAGGDGCKGYRHTDEHKIYIKEKLKGNRPWLGKKHSEGTRAKMSAARAEYWANTPHFRKQPTPKPPGLIISRGASFTSKQVECLSTGEVFASVISASRHTGCDRKTIRLACNGARRLAGRLSFRYLEAAA